MYASTYASADIGLLERSGPKVVEKLRSVAHVLHTNVPGSSGLTQPDSGTALRNPFSLEELREAVTAALDDHRWRARDGYPPVA